MCCIFSGSSDSISLGTHVKESLVKQGIKVLAKSDIQSINIDITILAKTINFVVEPHFAKDIHDIASSFKNNVIAIGPFQDSIGKLRKDNPGLNETFRSLNRYDHYFAQEEGVAKVTLCYSNGKTHCSKAVAAALQHLYWIPVPMDSAASSHAGTISSPSTTPGNGTIVLLRPQIRSIQYFDTSDQTVP